MFKRIMLCLELEEKPEKISEAIKKLTDTLGMDITLIHIVDMDSAGALATELEAEDRELIKDFEKSLKEQGYTVNSIVKIGNPADEINRFAEEDDMDVIIIGYKPKGFIERAVLGSVSREVLKKTKRPVLLLRDLGE